MSIIANSDIIMLRKQALERFGIKIHIHDSCIGQSFSMDECDNKELKEFINEYFRKKKYQVIFMKDGYYFKVEEI